jgi:hypothetical protein
VDRGRGVKQGERDEADRTDGTDRKGLSLSAVILAKTRIHMDPSFRWGDVQTKFGLSVYPSIRLSVLVPLPQIHHPLRPPARLER